MLKISRRLIFGKENVLFQDLQGKVIRTFQKSDFLTSGGRYRVTESLLGEISGNLLIEIDVPIAVEVTFKAQINANTRGAKAYANAPRAIARATTPGARAYANTRGAEAYATEPGAKAYAIRWGAEAYAETPGAEAYTTELGAVAYATEPGAIAYAETPGARAYATT